MSISTTINSCEGIGVNTLRKRRNAWLTLLLVAAAGWTATAQPTNQPAGTNASPQLGSNPPPAVATPAPKDESAFRLIAERNIFNANRSGGQVRLASRRPASVETFTLVGTMAYAKGAFAFFSGSSSELTKAVKVDEVIAGHKLADIYASSVKLEADGKQIELPIGSQMRREDAGTWRMAANVSDSNSGGESPSPAASRSETQSPASKVTTPADQAEILKRLKERREKE